MKEDEIHEWLASLQREIGPRAWLQIGISSTNYSAPNVGWSLYPDGVASNDGARLSGSSETFADAVHSMVESWNEHKEKRDEALVDKMAVALIRNYFNYGSCTDLQLRVDCGVDQATIKRLYDAAEQRATVMGMSGPFTVTFTDMRDNGAPSE